jgi:hypothetical protein
VCYLQVKPVEAVDEIPTTFNPEKKEPQWRIGHLLLFFDSFDTPRIPLNLFKRLCEIRVHGAPGPVYINLLKATGKFSIIVVFLFFVMIVVMAFGSAHQMSSTNQTLATLAGGFVPMLLKNVLSSKGARLNLKTLSFKGQIDEIISEYKQNWPIYDFVVQQYDPKEEEEKEREKEREKELEQKKDQDGNDKGNEAEKKDADDGETVRLAQTVNEPEKKPIVDTVSISRAGSVANLNSTTANALVVPDPFKDSLEDLTPIGAQKKGPEWMRKLSLNPEDNNFVDMFIDLSKAQNTAPWEWMYGSNESVAPSITMLNEMGTEEYDERMPYQPTIAIIDHNGHTIQRM